MERIWESIFGRAGKRTAERAGERAGLAVVERRALTVSSKRIALKRLGRGALISVPVLGGVFALWLCRADMIRAGEEWNRKRSDLVWMTFIAAALADGTDAITHFVMAYALLTETMGHHELVLVESISLACAIISTLFAVGGELLSQLKIRRAVKRREEQAGNEKLPY
jgi:hypothetical protein